MKPIDWALSAALAAALCWGGIAQWKFNDANQDLAAAYKLKNEIKAQRDSFAQQFRDIKAKQRTVRDAATLAEAKALRDRRKLEEFQAEPEVLLGRALYNLRVYPTFPQHSMEYIDLAIKGGLDPKMPEILSIRQRVSKAIAARATDRQRAKKDARALDRRVLKQAASAKFCSRLRREAGGDYTGKALAQDRGVEDRNGSKVWHWIQQVQGKAQCAVIACTAHRRQADVDIIRVWDGQVVACESNQGVLFHKPYGNEVMPQPF